MATHYGLATLHQPGISVFCCYGECYELQVPDRNFEGYDFSHASIFTTGHGGSWDRIGISAQCAPSSLIQTNRSVQIEKIFDIACTLTDVMAIVPMKSNTSELGPREYLAELVALISRLRGGQQRYLPLLLSKINETIPDMTMSITPHMSSMSLNKGHDAQISSSRSNSSSHSETTPSSTPPGSTAHPTFDDAAASTAEYQMAASYPSEMGFGEPNSIAPLSGHEQRFSYESGRQT